MRKIKFRGKNFYTGQWEFGDLETCPTADFCIIHRYKEDDTYNLQAKVVKNTVGQFTGLRDKNDKDIYEGDIIAVRSVEHKGKMIVHEIFYDEREGRFKAGLNGTHNSGDFGCGGLDDDRWVRSKVVIGNIYDNPELVTKRQ